MAAAPLLQPRPPRPSLELALREDICFHHPGYDSSNILFTLPRVDGVSGAGPAPTYGVHHRTALVACQIVAGNAFTNTYLALDRAGRQRVEVPMDGVLTDSHYYFIVDGSNSYPIVPSFQDWEFPHDYIPDFWPSPAPPSGAFDPVTCGITSVTFAIDEAHLVPQSESVWYGVNNMQRYGTGFPNIDNQANILPLRKDIHHCFDRRWFVIVPKIYRTETETRTAPSSQYVTHIISREAKELWPVYHNVIVETQPDHSRAYLFAHFAWAILSGVKFFVIQGDPRLVIRLHKDENGKIEYKAENCTGKVLQSQYGGGGSLVASPSKRKSGQRSVADNEGYSSELSEDSDDGAGDPDRVWDMGDRWGGAERRREQRSTDETAPDLEPDVQMKLEEALHRVMSEQQTAASREGS